MNKQRRKTIDELIEKIEALKDDVQSVQDNQTLTTIKAKQKLGFPLTDHERAMFTLYGENTPVTDAETAARHAIRNARRICGHQKRR